MKLSEVYEAFDNKVGMGNMSAVLALSFQLRERIDGDNDPEITPSLVADMLLDATFVNVGGSNASLG